MNRSPRTAAALLGAVSLAAAPFASAAVDVTDVTASITAQLVPIGLVGVAVLSLLVAIKCYKWIRRAM